MVQYEDRSKLMHGSLSTVPDFQVVAETEVENLVVRDSERILKESGYPRLNFNPGSKDMHKEIRHGTNIPVPLDPLTIGGGTISNDSSNVFVRNSSLTSSKGISFPNQESRRKAAAAKTKPTTPTIPTVQKVGTKVGPEVPQIKDKNNEEIFLVLPSYAEPHSRKIQQIIEAEKQKLCKRKQYDAIFNNVTFRLAFSNNKSIKKLVVRTKI